MENLKLQMKHSHLFWMQKWPELVMTPTRKALKPEFWDKAAGACLDWMVPPSLLYYCCYSYLNIRPEDPVIPFRPTVFRSRTLMDRAVLNFRDLLLSTSKQMEKLWQLNHQGSEYLAPRSTLKFARGIARMSLEYYREVVVVHCHPLKKSADAWKPETRDTVRYVKARPNPFLLLPTLEAEGPLKKLATHNARWLCAEMPWHTDIWEGIAGDMLANSGENTENIFDGPSHYHWPLDPWSTPYLVVSNAVLAPSLLLMDQGADPKTDSYLQGMLDLNSRSADPYRK